MFFDSLFRSVQTHRSMSAAINVIAMHGWAGDSRCWTPWVEATKELGWRWQCAERGYGELAPFAPVWTADPKEDAFRIVIGHSLGPHLLAADVLRQANAVILLASFATFVPPGRAGRRMRAALDGMSAKLRSETEAREMLGKFLANAADPAPAKLMPRGPNDDERLDLAKLRQDLDLLGNCGGLPPGFPRNARALIVEAACDKIVASEARELLRAELPDAEVMRLEKAGHALLEADVIGAVTDRVKSWQ